MKNVSDIITLKGQKDAECSFLALYRTLVLASYFFINEYYMVISTVVGTIYLLASLNRNIGVSSNLFLLYFCLYFQQVLGSWNKKNGSLERYCEVFAICRDVGLHNSNLQRQNWYSDHKYDVCFKGDHLTMVNNN